MHSFVSRCLTDGHNLLAVTERAVNKGYFSDNDVTTDPSHFVAGCVVLEFRRRINEIFVVLEVKLVLIFTVISYIL